MDRVEFWKVYGGTLLGIAAFAMFTLFNSLNAELADLRHEVIREREARADLLTSADLAAACNDPEARLAAVETALGGAISSTYSAPRTDSESPLVRRL